MHNFPAAHSMDTEWFAVDADGNIGIFDSGEGGAIPESNTIFRVDAIKKGLDCAWLDDIHDLFWEWSKESDDRVINLNIPAIDILKGLGIDSWKPSSDVETTKKVRPKILPPSTSTPWVDEQEISNSKSVGSWGCADTHWLLVIAKIEADIFKILKNHSLRNRDYIVHFSGEPALIFLPHCPSTTLQMLFEKGYVHYAVPLKAYRNGLATLLGFFSYWHDYSSPFPYECDGQPIYPLKLDDLPEKLQDVVTWNWFDQARFSENRKLQPIEYMRCNTWGRTKWWVDTQGSEREGHPHDRS